MLNPGVYSVRTAVYLESALRIIGRGSCKYPAGVQVDLPVGNLYIIQSCRKPVGTAREKANTRPCTCCIGAGSFRSHSGIDSHNPAYHLLPRPLPPLPPPPPICCSYPYPWPWPPPNP